MSKLTKQRENNFVCTFKQNDRVQTYNALKDPYLEAYFHLPSIRKHLKQVVRREKTQKNISKHSQSKHKSKPDKFKKLQKASKPQSATLMPYLIPRRLCEHRIDQIYREYNSLSQPPETRRRVKTKS